MSANKREPINGGPPTAREEPIGGATAKGEQINDGPPTARDELIGGMTVKGEPICVGATTAKKNQASRRRVPIHGDSTTANLRIPLLNHVDAVGILKDPSREVVILDFETSGCSFRKTGARVIEIGAAIIQNGEIIRSYQTLCLPKPNFRVPQFIKDLTGITSDMLDKCGKSTRQAMTELREFIGDRIIVAHNARFDYSFLYGELSELGLDVPGSGVVCTLGLSRVLLPELPKHKLTPDLKDHIDFELSAEEDVQFADCAVAAHRAMYDVLVTVHLWWFLLKVSCEKAIAGNDIKHPQQNALVPKSSGGAIARSSHKKNIEDEDPYTSCSSESSVNEEEEDDDDDNDDEEEEGGPFTSSSSVKSVILKFSEFVVSRSSVRFALGETVIVESRRVQGKNTLAEPSWWESYANFFNGDELSIVWQKHSRGLKLPTIIQHTLKAFIHGEPVDLARLAVEAARLGMGPPCRAQFDALDTGASIISVKSLLDPFPSKDLLLNIPMVDVRRLAQADTKEKIQMLSIREKKEKDRWYVRLAWWRLMKYSLVSFEFDE